MSQTVPIPHGVRLLAAAVLIVLSAALMAGALAIPFLFESPSMWYKFGFDKTSLRAGKMLGMGAGLLILLQLPLAGRLKTLDRIFSLPGLMNQHRRQSWVIVTAALLHPLGVLLPEGKLVVPLELRYWPEWIGVGLLVVIVIQFASSQWRQRWGIPFQLWLPGHRLLGLLVTVLLIVHILYVSETFAEEGVPRTSIGIAAGIFALMWLWVRTGWLPVRTHACRIETVGATGGDCTRVLLTPMRENGFAYAPGQFVFVSFRSRHVSREAHPFTLSSSPSRPGALEMTIRASGDWTRTVDRLGPGDRAWIQGPFGRFGHLFVPPSRELVMIAGGIGITPMLSMLRFMADQKDRRAITLIWSNRSKARLVYTEELNRLAAKLTGLRRIHIFTRENGVGEQPGRLTLNVLKDALSSEDRAVTIFLCGPSKMMRAVRSALVAMGFAPGSIRTETFGL